MKVDRFIAALGLVDSFEMGEEASEKVARYVAEAAGSFLRAGGRFSWSEWEGMDPETRELVASIGDALRNRDAAYTAIMLRDPGVAEALLSGEDEKDIAARVVAEALANKVEARLEA